MVRRCEGCALRACEPRLRVAKAAHRSALHRPIAEELNGNLVRRLARKPSELLKSQLQKLLHHVLATVRRILLRNRLRSRQLPKCCAANATAAASSHAVRHLDL